MTLKTFLVLCRISNLPTVWMNVLTAGLLVSHSQSTAVEPLLLLLLALALSLFYMGGMSLNDFCDRHWDARYQPYRPIPAGKASATSVALFASVLLGTGLGLLLLAPQWQGFVAGVLLLAIIIVYDIFHKAHPATVLLMAAARLLVFIVAAQALTSEWIAVVFLAGGVQFGYTLLVTLVARYEHSRGRVYSVPLIPLLIAGMAVVDGLVLAVMVTPHWIWAGLFAALVTRFGQRYVRGD